MKLGVAMGEFWKKAKASIGDFFGKQDETGIEYSADEKKIFVASFRVGWTVFAFAMCGNLAVVIWALGASTQGISTTALLGADLLIAGAAAAVGSLFGFVFGIPRTVDVTVAADAAQGDNLAAPKATLATNTNLERISDWLTTLLIGATLVQIKDIVGWVGKLGTDLTVGGSKANDAIVPIIVIYFFALSFLGVYLITRLYLTNALGIGGSNLQAPRVKPLNERLSAAAGSSRLEELKRALQDIDEWKSTGKNSDDPEINANAARIIIKLTARSGVQGRDTDLARFLGNAVKNPDQKKKLQTELSAGALTTGVTDVDAAVKKALE
jgi:hypothetical protein